jgi:hypothetical protein
VFFVVILYVIIPETYGYPEKHSGVLYIRYRLLSVIPRHEIHKNRASETVSLTKCVQVVSVALQTVTLLSGSQDNIICSSCLWTTPACTWAMIENSWLHLLQRKFVSMRPWYRGTLNTNTKTNNSSVVVLRKLIFPHLIKKFPAFYEIWLYDHVYTNPSLFLVYDKLNSFHALKLNLFKSIQILSCCLPQPVQNVTIASAVPTKSWHTLLSSPVSDTPSIIFSLINTKLHQNLLNISGD